MDLEQRQEQADKTFGLKCGSNLSAKHLASVCHSVSHIPSSWVHSTWGASEVCFTSNGKTSSQTQRFSRGLRWWAYTRDMCAACQMSTCLGDYSVESWKVVHAVTEVSASDTKTHWSACQTLRRSELLRPCRSMCDEKAEKASPWSLASLQHYLVLIAADAPRRGSVWSAISTHTAQSPMTPEVMVIFACEGQKQYSAFNRSLASTIPPSLAHSFIHWESLICLLVYIT